MGHVTSHHLPGSIQCFVFEPLSPNQEENKDFRLFLETLERSRRRNDASRGEVLGLDHHVPPSNVVETRFTSLLSVFTRRIGISLFRFVDFFSFRSYL